MDRRQFIDFGIVTGASLLATVGTMQAQAGNKIVSNIEKSKMKQWAHQQLRGGEAFILPSMTPDFKQLDEAGIRLDVQHSIAQGFCSVMPLQLGIDDKTYHQLQKIVIDEAAGKLNTIGVIRAGSWKNSEQSIRTMEALGVSHAMMYFNHKLPDQNAIYAEMRSIIENTSLGIVLYASPKPEIFNMDPTGLPIDAFDRVADLDNVIGVKYTQELRAAAGYALAERLGDRLLLAVVNLETTLPLSLKHNIQMTGQWGIDSLQSPDQPWVNEFLTLLSEGKGKQAYDLYWRYEPIATAFYDLQADLLAIGGHPWVHIKYLKWLTGGNGGLLGDLNETPERVPYLTAEGRQHCRDMFASVGIKTVDLPDEAFVVGNAAYQRGVRMKDLTGLPQYKV